MKDENEKKTTANDFDAIFKKKAESFRVEPDANCWSEIDARLHKKDKRRIPVWWWIPVGAAALIALLLNVYQPTGYEQKRMVAVERHELKNIKQVHSTKTVTSDKILASNSTKQRINKKELLPVETKPIEKKETKIQTNETNQVSAEENQPIEKVIETEETAVLPEVTHPDSLVSTPKQTTLLAKDEPKEWESPKKKQSLRSWQLLASVSTSGSAIMNNNSDSYLSSQSNNSPLSNAHVVRQKIQRVNDFSDKNYMPPLTFGLNVRKQINRCIGLQSGLMYTYLLSTFKNDGTQRKEAKLHLHYIGVPLNLVVTLVQSSKWGLYLSGGGAVEKGIKSVYTQTVYYPASEYTTSTETDIDGLQWSVNASVGASYNLYKQTALYIEPKFSYFFDNNQPACARTDKAITVGVAAGIRFTIH